jgi:two-component sensor histidine kinase
VSRDEEGFVLEVRNDGARPGGGDPGMGLRLAQFEALQQSGTVESGPVDGDGWRVRLVVPLRQEAE